MSSMRIAVLVTVYNRATTTVRGLQRLASLAKAVSGEFEFSVFLVDDGSTDGTGSQVSELPLDISVIQGTGSLYWNRGMILAHHTARNSDEDFDAFMLYNDDVLLDDNFIPFLRQFRDLENTILVGALREPASGEISYSGVVRVGGLHPFTFIRPELSATLVPVDTFNANIVLIPAKVFERLGGLDPAYTHAGGDYDLGLRAGSLGIRSYVYGSTVGDCERGPSLDQRIRTADLKGRWKLLFGYPHGPGQHLYFVRKHGVPLLFPIYAIRDGLRRVVKLIWRTAKYPR